DPEHDLPRIGPRPCIAPPADGLPAVTGAGVSWVRERGRQGAGGETGDAPTACRGPRRADLWPQRVSDPGLRPVRGLGRPEPGGLPGPEPDAAGSSDAPAAPEAPGYGQGAGRLRPRRPGDLPDDQPRPVRRSSVRTDHLQRRADRVPNPRGVRFGPGEVWPNDARPVLSPRAAVDRGGRVVCDRRRP